MRIVVACDELQVASSLESATGFMVYTVNHGRIVECQNIPSFHLALPNTVDVFCQLDTCALIARTFDTESRQLLTNGGIDVYSTDSRSPRLAAEQYLQSFLLCPMEALEYEGSTA